MTTYEPLDRSLATLFAEEATAAGPHDLADRIVAVTARLRPRPTWRARIDQAGWITPSRRRGIIAIPSGSRAWLLVALALVLATSVVVAGSLLRDRPPVLRGVFVPAGSLPTPGTVALLRPDGFVLVFGGKAAAEAGLGSLGNDAESVLLFDPASGHSREIGMTPSSVSFAVPLEDGRVLAIGLDVPAGVGGGSSGGRVLMVDPATETVRELGTTFARQLAEAGVRLADGRVLLVGDAAGTAEVELFDPVNGTFAATGSTTRPMMQPTATLLQDGRVLVVGDREPVAEIFDPATGTFGQTGPMSGPHEAFTATLLRDGRVLIAGGWATNGTVVDGNFFATEPERLSSMVEIFDPSTGQFGQVGPMVTPRVQHFAVALADGRVLIGGGRNAAGSEALSAEIFDPATGTFIATGPLTTARFAAGALFLPDGRVLVIGSVPELGATNPTELLAASSLEVFE